MSNGAGVRRPSVGRFVLIALTAAWCGLGWSGGRGLDVRAQEPEAAKASRKKESKYRDFGEVTEGATEYDGLFKLYEVDDHLYAELKPNQFNQMFLAPIAIARGAASAGTPLNFGDEWIISFRRVNDRILLIRNNIHYEAPKDTPLARAVEQNYTDSILMALPIVSINPRTQGVLIDFSSIFLSDFAELGLGMLDRSRSSWHKIKAFENNVELQVEATFNGGRFGLGMSGDDGVVDSRGITVIVHYSLAKRPEPGYKPRYADQRIGHFISATKDFGASDPDTTFRRRINRWRLEKANPDAKLSPPTKQIVWWVENTVPHEYRPYVEEGILEWNKAFERIGFRNALGVRWQNDQDEFDPEDINYCTFRWITTPSTFAMSGLRADPITGEMIDGDVIFDASWIRAWKQEYAFLIGQPIAATGDLEVLDVAEIISPMMAARYGFGVSMPPHQRRELLRKQLGDQVAELVEKGASLPALIPSDQSPITLYLRQRASLGRFNACQYSSARRHEYTLAAMALAARAERQANASEEDDDEDDDEEGEDGDKKDKDSKKLKFPEELIGQAIKEVVMHEVGHSLGLRHNFKASAMLSLEEINNPEITRKRGMVGSVMDYNPLNIAREGEKQGDYAATTLGPYDYWAIEYAYKPISGNEQKELESIAARSSEPDLIYATDEDLYSSNDPLVNTYDLGNDTLRYAKDRILLAQDLLKDLDDSIVKDGESWARLRQAFSVLLSQYGNAAYMATNYIGGQYFSRDAKGGEKSRDPVVPVDGEKQREALEFVVKQILTDEPFQFEPELLRRLTVEHWYHWGSDMMMSSPEYNVNDRILSLQRIVLNHCLSADTLRRLQNQTLMVGESAKPLTISEVFRTLTDHVWSELEKADGKQQCSLIRRNLQREHLRRLIQIVVGPSQRSLASSLSFVVSIGGGSYPADARSLARMHLRELHERLDKALERDELEWDPATRAHYEEARDMIDQVLDAEVVVDP